MIEIVEFFSQITHWGIDDSIIITEESWITFVLPLPVFDVFDSNHFLKNFESKFFIIKIYISQIILLTIICWWFYCWLEWNWSTSIGDIKNDQVEAKNKNRFRVTRVGRSFCFCSLFLFSISIWRFMKYLFHWWENKQQEE